MIAFPELARAHQQPAYFRLLYVGTTASRREAILDGAQALGCFERIESAEPRDDFAKVKALVESNYTVADDPGCAVVILDMSDCLGGKTWNELLPFLKTKGILAHAVQCVVFALGATDQTLPFRDFIEGINHDVAGLGDASQCLDSLKQWCKKSGDLQGPIDLRGTFTKKPSRWLREIKHDYLANTIAHVEGLVRTAVIWEDQRHIDFWQNVLRNTLIRPYEAKKVCQFYGEDDAETTDLAVRIRGTACVLFVPRGLDGGRTPVFKDANVQYQVYDSQADAQLQLEQAGKNGHARILIVKSPDEAPKMRSTRGGATRVPSLLVTESETRLSWSRWQQLLASNVLGAFTQAQFFSNIAAGPFPSVKLQYWRPFCFLSLPEVVDEILAIMIRSYEDLRDLKWPTEASDAAKAKFLESMFLCLAQVWCAHGLYFGTA